MKFLIQTRHAGLLLVLLALFSVTSLSWAKAPFTDLIDIDGKAVSSEANVGEGKWTVVMVWSTSCHICTAQKPMISKFHNEHADKNAHVIGIALDGPSNLDDVQRYVKKHDVSFPTYVVPDINFFAVQYAATALEDLAGTPTYLIYNPDGKLLGVNPGPVSEGAFERFIERNTL